MGKPLPIPIVVLLLETPAMLAGMAGFSAIVAAFVSIVYAAFRFVISWPTFEGLMGVAGGVFLACFFSYVGWDFPHGGLRPAPAASPASPPAAGVAASATTAARGAACTAASARASGLRFTRPDSRP